MNKKDFQELKNKSLKELWQMEADFRDKLWNLTEDLKRGKVKNIREVHEAKKDIARVLTAMASLAKSTQK